MTLRALEGIRKVYFVQISKVSRKQRSVCLEFGGMRREKAICLLTFGAKSKEMV